MWYCSCSNFSIWCTVLMPAGSPKSLLSSTRSPVSLHFTSPANASYVSFACSWCVESVFLLISAVPWKSAITLDRTRHHPRPQCCRIVSQADCSAIAFYWCIILPICLVDGQSRECMCYLLHCEATGWLTRTLTGDKLFNTIPTYIKPIQMQCTVDQKKAWQGINSIMKWTASSRF